MGITHIQQELQDHKLALAFSGVTFTPPSPPYIPPHTQFIPPPPFPPSSLPGDDLAPDGLLHKCDQCGEGEQVQVQVPGAHRRHIGPCAARL